ncbi:hypothetical protein Mapa_010415 [Marchantia paleacea]|nr:hypothetical protein Mapa_010415 [Marchantia paleacea]
MQRCHLFVHLVLELYGAMYIDLDMFVRYCEGAYHTRRHGVSFSLGYCIVYFRQRVSIALQIALAGAITLGDASSDAMLFVYLSAWIVQISWVL